MTKIKLNAHQIEASLIIQDIISDMIGGYENTKSDFEEGSEEWKEADKFLSIKHDDMIELLYEMVIKESQYRGKSKHINFAGTDWIKSRLSKKLIYWGY